MQSLGRNGDFAEGVAIEKEVTLELEARRSSGVVIFDEGLLHHTV